MTTKHAQEISLLLQEADRQDCEGRFAGPDEDLEAYASHKTSPNLQQTAPQELVDSFRSRLLVDISKIPIKESAKGLMPWELACCWIDDAGEATIHVRPSTRTPYIHINLVIAHELVHAMRGRIGASIFEEFTAYAATASMFPHYISPWRTFLGPLFSSAVEVTLLVAAAWGCWLLPFFLSLPILPFLSLPVIAIGALLLRLNRRWNLWNAAFKNLEHSFAHLALPLIVRMSDKEILWIAKLPQSQVRQAFAEQSANSWRFFLFCKKFSLPR